jgi:hypothetical protein
MSDKVTPDDDKKRDRPSQQPLPPVEGSEELSETDLDGMAGGWSLITPTLAQA